ncbi:MAG TPA: NAD(P)H-dependent glycerol-3-phosphate dehydrogenase [Acidimicrobiales bacterium]|nr:NAD(P)H-dependent glycerol-3-phosphate dehydrogenase [Acidimicrobiales bacterium]
MATKTVAVVGAGSWGTTVASLVSANARTVLWARSAELADVISRTRQNPAYLPGIDLPASLRCTASLPDAVADARVVLMAVPSHGFRQVLRALAPSLSPGAVVISLAKGIEVGTNLRMSEVIATEAPGALAGVLTGPNLAREIAEGQPAASVVALHDPQAAQEVQRLLHTGSFRVYTATDVVGCEIAGATKNVLAIAAGICDGLGLGENTRALLITRGLAELRRLGIALGGHALTFSGLAGVGDVVATCASPRSRNRTVGFELGRGRTLPAILRTMRMVAEGVGSATPLVHLARAHAVEMPIAEQVHDVVLGRSTPREALDTLMHRPARAEWDEPVRGVSD